jgi:hypothetical protein
VARRCSCRSYRSTYNPTSFFTASPINASRAGFIASHTFGARSRTCFHAVAVLVSFGPSVFNLSRTARSSCRSVPERSGDAFRKFYTQSMS